MTSFAVLALVAVVLLSLEGNTATATGLAVGISAFALLLDISYRVRARGRSCLILAPRRYLDRVVRAQWLGLLITGSVLAQISAVTNSSPWSGDSSVAEVVIGGFAIGITTIYASSLTDWYWVLPKISGIVAPPPCTTVIAKASAGVTKIWFFHRAVATIVCTALVAGVPAYIAGTATISASLSATLTLFGAAAAIGFNAATAGTVWAFGQFLSPRLEVGNYVRKRKEVDDREPEDGYVVDVSIQGVKIKLESDVLGQFVSDGDLIPYHEAQTIPKRTRTTAMCPSLQECRAANWYCLRNLNASTAYATSDRDPAPLPAEAAQL
jgi:hypothetical protein